MNMKQTVRTVLETCTEAQMNLSTVTSLQLT